MAVVTDFIERKTSGFNDMHDLTADVAAAVQKSGLRDGTATVFAPGSTAGITTIEFEPGLKRDLPEFFEKLAPQNKTYHHDQTWHDGNGFSHVRAALLGPSLVVPFSDSQLLLGTWQQITLIDFDNRPRQRRIVVQIIGE
ncbi:MAG: YjbQ family protein [Deferribacteres bacterium]|nr:secondary thiamine-phosphate synthase enzyme YjbQ [candidate division KSB1 bacterium]MCB9510974.1 YjbQ family protein [Deferribacteres bacterium]